MLALSAPFLHLRLGLPDQGNDPATSTTRQGFDLLADGFGLGFNGPLLVVTDFGSTADTTPTEELVEALRNDPGVAQVLPTAYLGGGQPGRPSPGGIGLTIVYPRSAPQDAATQDLVDRMRGSLIPLAEEGTEQQLLVGGSTAMLTDLSDALTAKLPLFVGVVVLLSFLLLVAVFRSLVVAALAALMNVLSAAAAFGVVVLVFQDGHGLELVGLDRTGPILAFLPAVLFAVLFGLSMDYEVFLLSRIKEAFDRSGRNTEATMEGLSATASVITSAALIMILVFGIFAFARVLAMQLMGFGLAVAVLLDATVIRMVLVPAFMQAMGRWNWWPGVKRITPKGRPSAEMPELKP
jgi:RND superfamily putative drug exporter